MRRDDDALERQLGWVLRGGVIASFVLLAAGLSLSIAAVVGRDLTVMGRGVSPAGTALIRAGIVVLIATPITRVAASAISYLISKDWLFVALTSIVLLELAAAVLAAISG